MALGNTALMQQCSVDVASLQKAAEALRMQGASVMYLAVAGRLAALAMSLSSALVIANALRLRSK